MPDSLQAPDAARFASWPQPELDACYDAHFDHQLDHAPVGAGDDQLHQLVQTTKLVGQEYVGRFANGDDLARSALASARELPLDPTQPVSHAEYASSIPGAAPDATFKTFVDSPKEIFGAAGLKLVPPIDRLQDGAKVMLEDRTLTPSVLAPVQVHLDPAHQTLSLHTLEGHPLRGANAFHFESDGQGGTRLHQVSDFQGSSGPTNWIGLNVLGAGPRQPDIWTRVHYKVAQLMEQQRARTP
jgi:hypothetical protein